MFDLSLSPGWLAMNLGLGLATVAQAGALGWTLPPFNPQELSNGAPIPNGAVFQLGVFADDFVPDLSNRASWATHWRAVDFARYDSTDTVIDGYLNIESNAPPFTAGKPLYVWGAILMADGSSEQWLGHSSAWQLPSANPLDFPEFIEIDDAETLLLGTADPIAGTIQMEAVPAGSPLPLMDGESWRRNYFTLAETAAPGMGGWQGDPDKDGMTNGLEFAIGTDPRSAEPMGGMRLQSDAGNLLLTLPGWSSAAVTLHTEESNNLQTPWLTIPVPPSYNASLSRWEQTVPRSAIRNFFRMRIEIPSMP